MKHVVIGFLLVLLAACESNPPAPVIERTPQVSKPKPPPAKPMAGAKEWRPDSHIVKKSETLFGIGLEYGVDYKEIAAANNIAAPYPIKIGQKIDLSSFKTKTVAEAKNTEVKSTDDGVVITPMKTEPAVIADKAGGNIGDKPVADTKPIVSVVTPALSEPKAVREPYSLAALNRAAPKPISTKPAEAKPTESQAAASKPAETKPNEIKPGETKPAETKPVAPNVADDESMAWAWPTQGKVVAGFNEASNKGIDIAGKTGQAISAASAGKVIYSGSDLRGYGKLVIIKHNKTYLSVYAHNSKIVVKEGQAVSAGQKIAEMGNTDSNSVKLHFEIRRLGKSVDPAQYLNKN